MSRERHQLGGDPRPVLGDLRGVEGSTGLIKEAHGGKDGNHQVVVREIDIHRSVEWEGVGGREQGAISL